MQQHFDPATVDLQERLVAINRVAKVVKGGRNFRFSALVVVGDQNGHVGCGMGKAAEVPEAIRKATEDAKKNMIEVNLVGTTISHRIIGKFGRSNVLHDPRPRRYRRHRRRPRAVAVLDMAGVRDIRTKSYGSNNPINCVKATLEGLGSLMSAEEVAKKRGKNVAELLG